MTIEQYDVVKVVDIRDDRFAKSTPTYQRHPIIGDVGTVLDVYLAPPGYEVECCAASDGITTWLEAMYPDEIEKLPKPDALSA